MTADYVLDYSAPTMNKPVEGQAAITLNGAEAAVEMLKAHGVEILFGLCGDTSLPFYDALARLPHGMRHVLTRDERSAGYMADGYARVSGKVGVCEGPSGGGATYILPGLAEANESSVPVLCINSDISVAARGRYTLTELDQGALMRPVTKWNTVLDRAQDIPRVFRAAFNQMTTGRPGAAHIVLPFDVQNGSVERADVWGDASLGRYPARRVAPDAVFCRARGAVAGRRGSAGFYLWRWSCHCRRGGGTVPACGTALGSRRHNHQRQGIDQRARSTGGRRRRLQRRHTGNTGYCRSGGSDRLRRLPRRLRDYRALAPSETRQDEGDSFGRGPANARRQLPCRCAACRRCKAHTGGAERGAGNMATTAGGHGSANGQGGEVRQILRPRSVRRETDQTGARGLRSSPGARSQRHRGRRRRYPLSLFLRILPGARHGAPLFF